MALPFEERSISGGRLGGFGSGRKKREFLAELESELARAEQISEVSPEAISELIRAKDIDFEADLHRPRCDLYRRFLTHCFADWALSEDEHRDLEHLRLLLGLSADEAAQIHQEVSRAVYGNAVDQVLDDYRLDPEERSFLETLRAQVGVSGETAGAIEKERRGVARQRFLEQSIVHGSGLVANQLTEVEFQGHSEESLEDAISQAAAVASEVAQEVRSAEVRSIRVALDGASVSRWDVTLRATVQLESPA